MADQVPTSRGTRSDPLSVLWRVAAAPQALLVLIGLVALTVALGSLIPQIPPQAVNDPQAWLAVQQGLSGPGNGLIRTLGLYDLYHTLWFRLLLVLAGLTLFVWLVEAAELAVHATRSAGDKGQSSWTSGDLHSGWSRVSRIPLPLSLSLEDAQALLRRYLIQHRYRLSGVADLKPQTWIATRRAYFLWAQPAVYGILLLALIGLAIVSTWGWQGEEWLPDPGDSQAVGHDSPYAVRLDAFDMQLGDAGRLRSYRSEITWLKEDMSAVPDVAGVGQPATLRGLAVRQVGYVPAVKMRAWDANERPLALQVGGDPRASSGEVAVTFTSPEAQPLIFVPSQDLLLVLTFEPLCSTGRPALHVDVVRAGGVSQQALGVLYESGPVLAGDLRLAVDLAYRPILRMDYRPGMALVLLGVILALVALAVTWIASPRLVWVAAGPGELNSTVIHLLVPVGLKASRWLPQLAHQLQKVLSDGS